MKILACSIAVLLCVAAPALGKDQPAWRGHANDPQHTAKAPAAGQPLTKVLWTLSIDHDPPLAPHQPPGGGSLLIHYASPMITAANTVLVPVKTTSKGNFEIDAVSGTNGKSIWTMKTNYVLPSNEDWIPALPAHLTAQNRLYVAGIGGTVLFRDSPDSKTGQTGQYVFYGMSTYEQNKKIYNADVVIDTPITADAKGDIFFGFVVLANNPAGLMSGIARIDANGNGSYVAAQVAAGDPEITEVAMNCAPAISADGSTVYIAVSNGQYGYLLALDATTLKTKTNGKVALIDPETETSAVISDNSSAAPTIGPDGSVYYGVLDSNGEHNCRGWLLAFSGDLSKENTPGSFGWDDTVSIVPTTAAGQKAEKNSYYVMSKYNDYNTCGGSGNNEIAILNPNATQKDEYSNVTVMKEVETKLDPHSSPNGGVYEWCVNTAVVDVKNSAIVVNDEAGYAYRWDLTNNTLQSLQLNAPIFEAYTSTLIGPDGTDYAINNATLYAMGN
jgi:hypothetical protein